MIILLHSSKTMKTAPTNSKMQPPQLISKSAELGNFLKKLSVKQVGASMKLSPAMAQKTYDLIQSWSTDPNKQSLAIDTFKGDIFSGLQAQSLTAKDRDYANKTLVFLSGLYGLIQPYDGIMPYRVEMAYKFPKPYDNLYNYWGKDIADLIPSSGLIVNVSSVEYSKTITPYVDASRIITPQFFTVSPKTDEPTFVTVHSKIARGAFARWLITSRAEDEKSMQGFDLLGYAYDAERSLPGQPAYVTKEFGGIGLSIRLQ